MKSDDVSQEAWDAAVDATREIADAMPLGIRRAEIIARAITAAVAAEREACAVVARDGYGPAGIAAAIRARSTPC